jgi:hypothetical protein
MALTYKVITAINLSSNTSTIDIPNIPSTYDDLVLYLSIRGSGSYGTGAYGTQWSFNGSTSNRSAQRFYGAGSVGGDTSTAIHGIIPGQNASTQSGWGMSKMYIPDYTSSRTKITMIDSFAPGNASNYEFDFIAGHWNDTTAINRITITPNGGDSFVQHTTATLIGIKKS